MAQDKNLVAVSTHINEIKSSFEGTNTIGLAFKKEAEFAIQALESNSFLMTTAMGNPKALQNAVTNIAAIGISLNPAQKLAYLVPRGRKVCLDISYMGLVKLATDSGSVLWVQAEVVKENDSFESKGVGVKPEHNSSPFSNRGKTIGVYCVAKTIDGEYLTEIMSLDECHSIRNRTEAYKAVIAGKTKSCPWTTDEDEMCKKTAIKRASKLWPKSERVNTAIAVLNEHEGINFKKEIEVDVTPPTPEMLIELDEILLRAPDSKAWAKRLIVHISEKYKTGIESITDMTGEHVSYAIKFLSQHLPKE